MKKYIHIKNEKLFKSVLCMLCALLVSLCSVNIYNYQTLFATTSQEEILENENQTDNNNDENVSETIGDDNTNQIEESDSEISASYTDTNGQFWSYWNEDKFTSEYTSSSGKIYNISTAEQLAQFAISVNNGSTYSKETVRLNADIDLTGKDWMPIGFFEYATANLMRSAYFAGTFEGNNHVIYGMTIDARGGKGIPYSSTLYFGLFGYTKGATIQNLTVSGSIYISTAVKFEQGTWGNGVDSTILVGGVVGKAESKDTFKNVASWVKIDADRGEKNLVGGIVGEAHTGPTLTNCANYGNITVYSDNIRSGRSTGWSCVGGIVGHVEVRGLFTYCANYGEITHKNGKWTGGILGLMTDNGNGNDEHTRIVKCFNAGEIYFCYSKKSDIQDTPCIGGIVGQLGYGIGNDGGRVLSCVNTGDLSVENSSACYYGPIAGYMWSKYESYGNYTTVTEKVACYYTTQKWRRGSGDGMGFNDENAYKKWGKSTYNSSCYTYSFLNSLGWSVADGYDASKTWSYVGAGKIVNSSFGDYPILSWCLKKIDFIVQTKNNGLYENSNKGGTVTSGKTNIKEDEFTCSGYYILGASGKLAWATPAKNAIFKGWYLVSGLEYNEKSNLTTTVLSDNFTFYARFSLESSHKIITYTSEYKMATSCVKNTMGGSVLFENGSDKKDLELGETVKLIIKTNPGYVFFGLFNSETERFFLQDKNKYSFKGEGILYNTTNLTLTKTADLPQEICAVFVKLYYFADVTLNYEFGTKQDIKQTENVKLNFYNENEDTFKLYSNLKNVNSSIFNIGFSSYYYQYDFMPTAIKDDAVCSIKAEAKYAVSVTGDVKTVETDTYTSSEFVSNETNSASNLFSGGKQSEITVGNGYISDNILNLKYLLSLFDPSWLTATNLDGKLSSDLKLNITITRTIDLSYDIESDLNVYYLTASENVTDDNYSLNNNAIVLKDNVEDSKKLTSVRINENGLINENEGEDVYALKKPVKILITTVYENNTLSETESKFSTKDDDSKLLSLEDYFGFNIGFERKEEKECIYSTVYNSTYVEKNLKYSIEANLCDILTNCYNFAGNNWYNQDCYDEHGALIEKYEVRAQNLSTGNLILYSYFALERYTLNVEADLVEGNTMLYSCKENGVDLMKNENTANAEEVDSDNAKTSIYTFENIKAYSTVELGAYNYYDATNSVFVGYSCNDNLLSNENVYEFKLIPTTGEKSVTIRVESETIDSKIKDTTIPKKGLYYEVGSVEDFLRLKKLLTSTENNNGGKMYYVRQTADIDFGEATITALGPDIGNGTIFPFGGIYDGQGYSIKNFTVTGNSNVGLFGVLKNATIKNLNIVNATVKGYNYLGALAGTAINSTFSRVWVDNVKIDQSGVSSNKDIFVLNSSKLTKLEADANGVYKDGAKNVYNVASILLDKYVTSESYICSSSFIGELDGDSSVNACYTTLETSGDKTSFINTISSGTSISECFTNADKFVLVVGEKPIASLEDVEKISDCWYQDQNGIIKKINDSNLWDGDKLKTFYW